jgi:SAM-dependent methyltransferase
MRTADYDAVSAQGYNARYRDGQYAGVQKALLSFVAAGHAVLEVGAGTGRWLQAFADAGCRVTGLELSERMLASAKDAAPAARLVQGSADALPFRDGVFDRVVCVNALHHFRNRLAFLKSTRRVLRPGGRFVSIGLDPHTALDVWWVYDYFPETIALDRERFPSASSLRTDMLEAGFIACHTREVQHFERTMSLASARELGYLDRDFTSQLTILSDHEFQAGLQRLRCATEAAGSESLELLLTTDLRLYATSGAVLP